MVCLDIIRTLPEKICKLLDDIEDLIPFKVGPLHFRITYSIHPSTAKNTFGFF